MEKTEEEFLKERSFEAQDEFLTDLFSVTLHGPLPGETQKKLFAAAAGMQSRCQWAREHIDRRIKNLETYRAGAKSDEAKNMWGQAIDELNALMRFLS